MNCPACATVNASDARFCFSCGTEVGSNPGSVATTTDSPAPPRFLVTGWSVPAMWATATALGVLGFHLLIGLLFAAGAVARTGVVPESISEIFQAPLRSLLASNGAVGGVGTWATAVVVIFAVAWRVRPVRHSVSSGGSIGGIAIASVKAGLVYAGLLVAASVFVRPGSIQLSPAFELPGELSRLGRVTTWSLNSLAVRSFAVASAAVLVVSLLGHPIAKERWALLAARAGRAFLAAVAAAGIAVALAGSLRLPRQPSVGRWIGQLLEHLGTAGMAVIDLGAWYLAAVAGSPGEPAPSPVRGVFAALVVACAATSVWFVARRSVERTRGATLLSRVSEIAGVGTGAALLLVPVAMLNEGDAVILGGTPALLIILTLSAVLAAPAVRDVLRQGLEAGRRTAADARDNSDQVVCGTCRNALGASDRFCGTCGALRSSAG